MSRHNHSGRPILGPGVVLVALTLVLSLPSAPGHAEPTPPAPPTPTPAGTLPATPSGTPSPSGPTSPAPTTTAPSASTAGPSTASPSTASPSTAGPSTAGPSTASPSTASPSTASPSTAAAPTQRPPTTEPPAGRAAGPRAAADVRFTRDNSPVRLRWQSLGGAEGWLGPLTENERVVAGGLEGRFVGGDILSASGTGPAYVVHGRIRTAYRAFGGPTSYLKFPTSDEQGIAQIPGARMNRFQDGAILWSSTTGAYPVYRAFWRKFGSLPTPYTQLGLPTGRQTPGAVSRSQKQVFTAGTLLWTSASGAHVVRGAIRTRYNAVGAEKYLGVPLTDEYAVSGGMQQKFAHGLIRWTRSTGATTVQADYRPYLTGVPKTVNALDDIPITGYVLPRVGGVSVTIDVLRSDGYTRYVTATTRSDGSFTARIGYRRSELVTVRLRAAVYGYARVWRRTDPYSIVRDAWQRATVRTATSADVRYTYRSGCPVGPSQLRVVEMNYYGFDARMHRGLMIVRRDKVDDIKNIYWHAMDARFPIRKMVNPDVYRGSDPDSMYADNTSGFNCRHVTGNPYRMSPHSYGFAFDVNPVENPYFDGSRWWPSNGTAYIQGGAYNRSPLKKGSLASYSRLTSRAKARGWFWGGAWSPGRDWQHFEER